MDTDRTSPSDSPSPRPNIPSTPMTRAAQPVAPSSSSKAALDQEAKIRNAAAQARHMEQTLVQLQERLRTSSTGDARLRQLEQENDRLHREIQHLRALWSASYGGSDDGQSPPPPSAPQSGAWLTSQEQYDPADYNVAASPDFDDFEEDTTASGLQGWTPPEQSQK
ncbi:hypothetical protein FRB97_007587 [Tulasnella sp. 331]|nr:hypothetical protein FRB97_007587 [Tulasnella sp. 331]